MRRTESSARAASHGPRGASLGPTGLGLGRIRAESAFAVHLQMVVLAAFIAWCSLEVTGFSFGKNNNLFHIPYVMRFIERPEFATDAFVRTLEQFTSAVWPPIRALASYFDPEAIFFVAHVANRFLTVWTLVLLARTCGLGVLGSAGVALLVTTSMTLLVDSPVARHEMSTDYFTQSIVTWPLIFLFYRSLLVGGFRFAAVALALIFDVNAFVAFWMLAVAACQRGGEFWRSPRKIQIQSALLFLLIVAPVAIWIARVMAQADTSFSFKQFARDYFPYHFLIEASRGRDLLRDGLYFVAGWYAAGLIANTVFWRRALACLLAIFLVGCVLPYLLDIRLVFNLHLLRSDGVLVATSLVVQALAFAPLLRRTADLPYRLLIGLVLAGAFAFPMGMAFAIASTAVFVLHGSRLEPLARQGLERIGFGKRPALSIGWTAGAAVACVVVLLVGYRASVAWARFTDDASRHVDASWQEMVSAIRRDGAAGPYLVPLGDTYADEFVVQAQRPVWVSWKEGAAVMWAPSFHDQWLTRWKDVKPLASPDALLAYARTHRITQVVLKAPAACSAPFTLKLKTSDHVWCSTAP